MQPQRGGLLPPISISSVGTPFFTSFLGFTNIEMQIDKLVQVHFGWNDHKKSVKRLRFSQRNWRVSKLFFIVIAVKVLLWTVALQISE